MHKMRRAFLSLVTILAGLALPGLAIACGVSAQRGGLLHYAGLMAGEAGATRITFLGHASFLIESPGGTAAVTDYSGMHRPRGLPDIVTMNHAHTTHFTDSPEAGIGHVLRGWRADGGPARHDVTVGDMRVRNLPTNIRAPDGGTQRYGNSVFVFESGGLCIAHLGHLHHLLSEEDIAILGPIDIVMVPVDGAWTSSQGDMVEVLGQLNPRLILPMHYWSQEVLERFLARMRDRATIRVADGPGIEVGRASLPPSPLVLVLPGPHF